MHMSTSFNSHDIDLDENLDKVIKIPFWLNQDKAPVFCWLHLPEDQIISEVGIILCSPLGYEQVHSHRSFNYLANCLAREGHAVVRFDFLGSGDSAFDAFYGDQTSHYLDNIAQVERWLKDRFNITQTGLIGLRTGATIAAHYCSYQVVDYLVLWQPYARGRMFVRETKALEKVAGHDKTMHEDYTDSGGFIYSNDSLSTFNQFNLLKQDYQVLQQCLLIERDDVPLNLKLKAALDEKLSKVEHYTMSGFLDMMAEPHESSISQACIERIVEMFSSKKATNQVDVKNIGHKSLVAIPLSEKEDYVEEKIVEFKDDNKRLFGILSQPPKYSQNAEKPLVIFINSGSVHHVGPNRIYTESSRSLAASGIANLRVDLSTLGDSATIIPVEGNTPYPDSAFDDINRLIQHCRSDLGFNKIVIAGLCSGAYHSWHSSLLRLDDAQHVETILINPLTFYRDGHKQSKRPSYHVEKDTNYYFRSAQDIKKWKGLFSGKVNVLKLLKFLIRKFKKTIKQEIKEKGQLIGLTGLSRLALDHISLSNKGLHITYFLATDDPGYNIIMADARQTINHLIENNKLELYMIRDADHTFSSFASRQEFIQLLTQHLLKRYPIELSN